MPHSPQAIAISKVTYRPIEAAIRWSGLIRHEADILKILAGRQVPEPDAFPQWPQLKLNTERLYDGIVNGELRAAVNGVVASSVSPNDPNLTVRHVDLKAWIARFYPAEKPRFLFSRLERAVSSAIGFDTMYALLVERETLRSRLDRREKENQSLRKHNKPASGGRSGGAGAGLSPRAEITYLNIIGALVSLVLGQSPSGQPYSSFHSQDAIISALVAHHPERLGISERTLEAKFAEARRVLAK